MIPGTFLFSSLGRSGRWTYPTEQQFDQYRFLARPYWTTQHYDRNNMNTQSLRVRRSPTRLPGNRSHGFTLVELLVVLAIITTIAGMLIVMLNGAREESRRLRTVSQIRRINQVLTDKWEDVGASPIRVNIPPATPLAASRALRVNAMRQLQRLEFPDRIADLAINPSAALGAPPSSWINYRLRVQATYGTSDWTDIVQNLWSENFEGAECLYLVLSATFDDEGSALRYFNSDEIGDVDGDLMPEILDQWGNPIEFIRWAPGYRSPIHEQDATISPDPFDPFKVDPRFTTPGQYFDPSDGQTKPLVPFNLFPLVYSAGPDEEYGVALWNEPEHSDGGVRKVEYANLILPNDPYPVDDADGYLVGATGDFDGDGITGHEDNIDNHWDIR